MCVYQSIYSWAESTWPLCLTACLPSHPAAFISVCVSGVCTAFSPGNIEEEPDVERIDGVAPGSETPTRDKGSGLIYANANSL